MKLVNPEVLTEARSEVEIAADMLADQMSETLFMDAIGSNGYLVESGLNPLGDGDAGGPVQGQDDSGSFLIERLGIDAGGPFRGQRGFDAGGPTGEHKAMGPIRDKDSGGPM